MRANLTGGEIKSIAKEEEDGGEQYEVESVLNGKARDFNVDSKGVLLVVEEATTIDAIPTAAKAGIVRKVGDGKLGTVETFTKPGQPMMYEAASASVNAQGPASRSLPIGTSQAGTVQSEFIVISKSGCNRLRPEPTAER